MGLPHKINFPQKFFINFLFPASQVALCSALSSARLNSFQTLIRSEHSGTFWRFSHSRLCVANKFPSIYEPLLDLSRPTSNLLDQQEPPEHSLVNLFGSFQTTLQPIPNSQMSHNLAKRGRRREFPCSATKCRHAPDLAHT